MAIIVNSNEENKILWWQKLLIIVSAALFLIFLGTYFYILFSEKKIRKELEKSPQEIALENDIKQKETDLDIKSKKILAFKDILSNHEKTANVFDFLEKSCLPDVWFSKFFFTSINKQVEASLSGETENFVSLGQQIIIFKNSPSVGGVSLESLRIGEKGGIEFEIRVMLNPGILNSLPL